MVEAMNSPNPEIAKIKKSNGMDAALAILAEIIRNGLKFFNVGKGMDAEQVLLTAGLILEDYYFLKPDDIAVVFRLAGKGRFGRIYDRIDSAIILEWVGEYCHDRFSEGANMTLKASNKPTEQLLLESSTNISPEIKEALKRLYSEFEQKKEVERVERQVGEKEKLIQGWIRQFDNIALRQGSNGAIRMINRYSQILDVSGYLNYKIEQWNKFN